MSKTTYWIRWFAVIPVALLGGLLLTFPLHWILYNALDNFIEPYPELPERILSPFVIGLGFMWLGSWVAPARKAQVAVVLFVLWVVLLVGTVAFTLFVGSISGRQIFFHAGGTAPIMAFVGSVIGLLIARRSRALKS